MKKIIILSGSLILSLLILESGLFLLTKFGALPSYKEVAVELEDPRLAYRIKPNSLPEIDSNGFRNPEVPQQADIVAIGDSMTYGYNAVSEDAWVYQLGIDSVYNISIGGGGPAIYSILIDEALKLNPKRIIVGAYMGNDFVDVCNMTNIRKYWREYAEEKGYDISGCLTSPRMEGEVESETVSWVKKTYLASYISSIHSVRKMVWRNRAKELVEAPEFYLSEQLKILVEFKPQRFDLSIPSVKAGFNLSLDFYKEMKDKFDIEVVIIPTKERVMYNYLSTHEILPRAYKEAVEHEIGITYYFSKALESLNIDTVHALPFMQTKILGKNPSLYSEYSRDGHPTKRGYKGIAEAVLTYTHK